MITPLALDHYLSPEQAAAVLKRIASDLTEQDQIPPDKALRIACERATDGDPLVIAARGQTWALRLDTDADLGDNPPLLAIHDRLTCPPRAMVTGLDGDLHGEVDEILLEVLSAYYRLESWDTSFLDPTAAS